ncbi:basic salivary proline-rich protein 1-like [Lepus europaeus]|uniref:basic salivary proline-rich protein 1-like n=1 Tax=Lepus europaeus TaxID=9983 RepID=UPI002B4999A5|nr:basic salivary proline-rich protein 1-like [Lepus europaeus]
MERQAIESSTRGEERPGFSSCGQRPRQSPPPPPGWDSFLQHPRKPTWRWPAHLRPPGPAPGAPTTLPPPPAAPPRQTFTPLAWGSYSPRHLPQTLCGPRAPPHREVMPPSGPRPLTENSPGLRLLQPPHHRHPPAPRPARRSHSPAAPSPRRPPGGATKGPRGAGPPLSPPPPPPPRLSPAPSPSAGAGGHGSLELEAPPPPPRAAARGERRAAPRQGPGRAQGRPRSPRRPRRRRAAGQDRTREGGERRRWGGGRSVLETASRRRRRSEPPSPRRQRPEHAAGRAGGQAGERARGELGTPAPDVRSRDCLIPAPRPEGRGGDVRGGAGRCQAPPTFPPSDPRRPGRNGPVGDSAPRQTSVGQEFANGRRCNLPLCVKTRS